MLQRLAKVKKNMIRGFKDLKIYPIGIERRGGTASEASLPPEASQVVAEGDGLRCNVLLKMVKIFFKLFLVLK